MSESSGEVMLKKTPANPRTANRVKDFVGEGLSEKTARSVVAGEILSEHRKKHLDSSKQREVSLAQRALTDSLTGVPNRGSFDETLEREWDSVITRMGQSLTVLMVDADNFKSINDEYGHPIGDEVLRHMARVLKEHIRKGDFIARYGGEEFALILPGRKVDKEEIASIIERLRIVVAEDTGFPEGIHPTVSIGAATHPNGRQINNHMELVKYADDALLEAKKTKNTAVEFTGDESNPFAKVTSPTEPPPEQ